MERGFIPQGIFGPKPIIFQGPLHISRSRSQGPSLEEREAKRARHSVASTTAEHSQGSGEQPRSPSPVEENTELVLHQPMPLRVKSFAAFGATYVDWRRLAHRPSLALKLKAIPRPPSGAQTVVSWLETVVSPDEETVISPDGETGDKPDNHLHSPEETRKPTGSAPVPTYTAINVYVHGASAPPSESNSSSSSEATSYAPRRIDIRSYDYRRMNLAWNDAYFQPSQKELCLWLILLLRHVLTNLFYACPTLDECYQDNNIQMLPQDSSKPLPEYHFKRIFTDCSWDAVLTRSTRVPMYRYLVPSRGTGYEIWTPVPDMLYGYDRRNAFPFSHLGPEMFSMKNDMVANKEELIFPFLLVQFIEPGDEALGQNLCLGGSATCVEIVERLNDRLRAVNERDPKQPKFRLLYAPVFSIALSVNHARLYVSWKQNVLDTYMTEVNRFCLRNPMEYHAFRNAVWSIIDWGRGLRFFEIQAVVTELIKEPQFPEVQPTAV